MNEWFSVLTKFDLLLNQLLPAFAVLIIWGFLAAIVSMTIYTLCSPQLYLTALEQKIKTLQKQLIKSTEPNFQLMRQLIGLSFKRLYLCLLPAIIASLPILQLWGFLHYQYAHQTPKLGQTIQIYINPKQTLYINNQLVKNAKPEPIQFIWPDKKFITLQTLDKQLVTQINTKHPQSYLHKRPWWYLFLPSPYGYLSSNAPVNEIYLLLPSKSYLSFGPTWLASWMTIFICAIIIFSLLIKWMLRIK